MSNSKSFDGFEHYSATFVFCPNAYLDYCVNHFDRGVVRLVGHVLYQTLRCLDSEGNPVAQTIACSTSSIVADAGVSRGSFRGSIDRSLTANFVECVTQPEKKSHASSGKVGEYRLCWSEVDPKSNQEFSGFYKGSGYRTPMPHAFYTQVLPNESLAVIRVVTAIIRNTVGYENQFGGRRIEHRLSYTDLCRITNLSRKHVRSAVKRATVMNYIEADPAQGGAATTYRIKWLSNDKKSAISSKRNPGQNTIGSVQKGTQEAFKKEPFIGSKKSQDEFKKEPSTYKEEQLSKKQQPAVENSELYLAVMNIGFESAVAARIVNDHPEEVIKRQLKYLGNRRVSDSVTGLFIRAVQEDWAPQSTTLKKPVSLSPKKPAARKRDEAVMHERQQRSDQRHQRLAEWGSQSPEFWRRCHERAIRRATSQSTRIRLQRHRDLSKPPAETLAVMTTLLADSTAK